jgi:hypothetical protein
MKVLRARPENSWKSWKKALSATDLTITIWDLGFLCLEATKAKMLLMEMLSMVLMGTNSAAQ